MDLKYLAERYERGCKKVQEYMGVHQRYIQLDSLDSGLPDMISSMQEQGGNKCLGFKSGKIEV